MNQTQLCVRHGSWLARVYQGMGKAHIEHMTAPRSGERFGIPCYCDIGEDHDFEVRPAEYDNEPTEFDEPSHGWRRPWLRRNR